MSIPYIWGDHGVLLGNSVAFFRGEAAPAVFYIGHVLAGAAGGCRQIFPFAGHVAGHFVFEQKAFDFLDVTLLHTFTSEQDSHILHNVENFVKKKVRVP